MSPLDPAELQLGIQLLREAVENGTFHVASHLAADFEASLRRLRFDASGDVIPDSVDARIRISAVMLLHRHQENLLRELKEAVPMEDIQEAYFSMVTRTFGDLEKFRKEVHATPYEIARWLAVQDDLIKANVAGILDFIAEVRDFWEHVAPPVWMHTQEQQTLKAVFTGEIFPDAGQDPASMYGFYVDTVVLPDPFLKMADVLPLMSERKRVSEIARLGLQMLQFRDLALTIADPPLLVVLPDRFGLETDYQSSITDIAAPDAVYHASRLFGREFLDSADVVDFVTRFETPAEVVGAIRRSEYLLFDVDWRGTPVQQLQRYLSSSFALPGIDQPGLQLWMQIVGRMGQATDALIRSGEVGGVPVMHAPTSWRWFNWKLERGGGDEPSGRDLEHLHTVQALRTAAGNQF